MEYTKVSSYEAKEVDKVVLLYSGGLDTSCILKWIQDKYQAEVITLTLDLGQQVDDLTAIQQKALDLGAKKAYVIDAKEEFAEEYLAKLIKANGSYQGDYHISTISRYLMAKLSVEIAKKEGADAIAHGCTGKGNDQVRIEATALAIDPDIKVIAPVREWAMGRDEELAYAKKHNIPVVQKEDFPYSCDDNMWGITWESGEIEDNNAEPKIEKFLTINQIEDTPDEPVYLDIGFDQGIPTSLNGKKMPLHKLIMALNMIAAEHGVGLTYMVEDRLVGLKVRGVYEHPGATVLIEAHNKLEQFTNTRIENEFKEIVDKKWAYLCYGALWMDPLMSDLDAFIDKVNETVTGTVKVKLHKGHAHVVALNSPHAVYDQNLATFDADYSFNQNCSPGFIEIYSLQMKLANQVKKKQLEQPIEKEAQ